MVPVLAMQPVIVVDVDADGCVDADGDAVLERFCMRTAMVAERQSDRHDLRTDYRVPDAINRLDRQLKIKKPENIFKTFPISIRV